MEFLAFLMIPACLLWAGIGLVRSNSFTLSAIFLVCTSVFTAEFFSLQAAGLTWTIDRFAFILLIGNFLLGCRRGRHELGGWESVDYLMGGFLVWLAARTFTQPLGSIAPHQPHTLMHLINGYCIPIALYWVLRTSKPEQGQLRLAFWILALFGTYLSITAVFEVTKTWTWVYPQFIADPSLGIHFGRARGPMLQSVRLGVCLIAIWCLITLVTVWLNPRSRASWVLAISTIPLFWGSIFLTYTRSIWLGLVLVVALLIVCCLRGTVRRTVLVSGSLAAIVVLLISGPQLIAFKREYSAAETRESTYMRAAFAYVSMQMFKDRPIAGFGFNQFNAANRPYLSDRSTTIRLESIRGYVHHNSYLSLLVDLGIIGFSLYAFLFVGLLRNSLKVWRNQDYPAWSRAISLLTLCVAGVHLIQMAFHEVSFSTIENSLLFGAFGLVMAVKKQGAGMRVDGDSTINAYSSDFPGPRELSALE